MDQKEYNVPKAGSEDNEKGGSGAEVGIGTMRSKRHGGGLMFDKFDRKDAIKEKEYIMSKNGCTCAVGRVGWLDNRG
jgi:hypothetical protein